MKLQGPIIAILLGLSAAAGVWYLIDARTFGSPEKYHTRFLVPLTFGIEPGHPIDGIPGKIVERRVENAGILFTIESDQAVLSDAVAIVAAHPSEPARIAIENNAGDHVEEGGIIRARIKPAPPREMLKPAPIWPDGPTQRPGAIYSRLAPLRRISPNDTILHTFGVAALSLGLIDEAIEAMTTITARDTAAAFNLALALSRNREPEKALAALDGFPSARLEFQLLRASILDDLGRTTEAVELLEAASALSPVATLNYAILLRKSGLVADSINVLQVLANSWPGQALVHYHLGFALEENRRVEKAREHYARAAKMESDPGIAAIFREEAKRLE